MVNATAALNYEEKRKQRLEENKKRMQELNLHKLSMSLKPSPKPSPAKKVKPKTVDFAVTTPPRRSSRTADKPAVNYKEDALEPLGRCRRVYSYNRRDLANRVYANPEDRAYAIERAEKLEADLGSNYPTCVKPMLQSHVTGGFWLSLPLPFCKSNLPNDDEMLTLVDENDEKWETKYLAGKNGLSGGWRGFAIDHELVDGDALIFQYIGENTLKVYIVRVNSSEDDDQNGNESND